MNFLNPNIDTITPFFSLWHEGHAWCEDELRRIPKCVEAALKTGHFLRKVKAFQQCTLKPLVLKEGALIPIGCLIATPNKPVLVDSDSIVKDASR